MNLKEQLYVCTLARCQTISRAAEELYISQPALSVYISNLEKYLGVKLFERTGKSFILTYVGEEYVSRAERMLEMKAEFDGIVGAVRQRYQGRVRLGIQTRRAVYVNPLLMEAFMERYPDVELVIRDGIHNDLVKLYENNQVDLLFGGRIEELRDTEYLEIGREHVLLMVPENHPANRFAYVREGDRYPTIDLKHFDKETFILPQNSQNLRTIADNILAQQQVRPGRIFEVRSFDATNGMIAKGLGIGFNRSGYVEFSEARNVQYYLIGGQEISYPLVISYKKGKEITPYMQCVIDLLKEIIGSQA